MTSMIPDSISTRNELKLDPVKVDLKIQLSNETMLFLGFVTLAVAIYGVKRLRS